MAMRTEILINDGWYFALGSAAQPPADGAFLPVVLPHDWAVMGQADPHASLGAAQGYFNRDQIGWYKRTLNVAFAPEERVFLCFGGVFENCTVWVNGAEAGRQRYGYTPFELDVTRLLQPGGNEVLVRVDNTAEPADRWYSGCGIYRSVKLLRLNAEHLDTKKIRVQTTLHADVASVYIDTGTDQPVHARLTAPDGTATEGAGRETIALQVAHPQLWSAETPTLYALTLELWHGDQAVDAVTLRIGLRSAACGPEGLYINGAPVKLRGVCLHQDFACVGIAVRPELWRERLRLLKGMGCNAIRAAHHIYAEEFLDLCDEMGFYVYEECFDKWHSGLYRRYFAQDWQHDLDAMILRDRNRPSVIIWGVGNEVENQAQESMLATLRLLTDRARTLDASRPVTYAMNPHFKRPAAIDLAKVKDVQKLVDEADEHEIEDNAERVERIRRIAALVDIISCNYQEQWYADIHRAIPDKPILGTEVYQYFMGHPDNMQNYEERLPSLVPQQRGYVIGSFIWTGFDYLGESMGWPSKGWTGSLFRTNNVPRFSYHVLKSLWRLEPMVRLGILCYDLPDEFTKESWAMPPFEESWDFPGVRKAVLPFMVATNCERVEVTYGEKKLLLDASHRDANGMLRGFIPYVPGKVTARGFMDGKAVCEHTLHTPGTPARLSFERPAGCRPGEQTLLTVAAQDAEGRFVMRADQTVRFTAQGGARIVAVDNGDLTCPLPYAGQEVPLYRGRASVLIERSGIGAACVTVSAEGLAPDTLVIG